MKVCGADGCQDVTDRTSMAITDGGPPTAWPDEKSPFYRVKISVKGEDGQVVPGWTFQWIPAAQKVQFEDGTWGNPPSAAMDELDQGHARRRAAAGEQAEAARARRSPPRSRRRTRRRPPPTTGCPRSCGCSCRWRAGAAGLLALLARGAAGLLGRRGGSATAG